MKTLLVAGFSLFAATFASHPAAAATKHDSHDVSHNASRRIHERSQRAVASPHHGRVTSHHTVARHEHAALDHGYRHHIASSYRAERVADRSYRRPYDHNRYYAQSAAWRYSPLQCVPYAREVSHIELTGNAYLWWAEAAGRYARGDRPEVGAVLNFRGIARMPLGHVAVVTDVINSRSILVTQANWVPDRITNDVRIDDVSPDNNWTEVRVELGDSSTLGSVYPTYGFIYNKPAIATVIAANGQSNEVAEAPAAQTLSTQAPDRNLQ
jgi:surface antigen